MFWGYFPLFTAIFTFPQERALLTKERRSDMYRLSSYFLSRTLGDLPLDLILTAIFMVIVYFMAHLRMSIATFCLTLLANFLNVITSQVHTSSDMMTNSSSWQNGIGSTFFLSAKAVALGLMYLEFHK